MKSSVVAIDSMCVCPKHDFVADYFDRVKLFLKDAIENEVEAPPPVHVRGKASILSLSMNNNFVDSSRYCYQLQENPKLHFRLHWVRYLFISRGKEEVLSV